MPVYRLLIKCLDPSPQNQLNGQYMNIFHCSTYLKLKHKQAQCPCQNLSRIEHVGVDVDVYWIGYMIKWHPNLNYKAGGIGFVIPLIPKNILVNYNACHKNHRGLWRLRGLPITTAHTPRRPIAFINPPPELGKVSSIYSQGLSVYKCMASIYKICSSPILMLQL